MWISFRGGDDAASGQGKCYGVREEIRDLGAKAFLLSARHESRDRTRGDETLRRLYGSPLFSSPATKSLCQARQARRIPGAL
jgi:hypothetical protein